MGIWRKEVEAAFPASGVRYAPQVRLVEVESQDYWDYIESGWKVVKVSKGGRFARLEKEG